MGFTNTTAHYSLPQYVATDKPKYLTDFNQTMEAIDTQMYTNAQAAATADGKAVAAKDVADGAVSSIGTLNTQINGDALDPSDRGLAGDVSDNSGAINTINALIGNGTPTTSDKTIIGAINEIYADITGGGTDVTAANVSYDNTASGLTADDVQEAIDEVYAAIPAITTPDAEDVSYDNTTSGLTASNVQAAIDELAQGGTASGTKQLKATSTGTTYADHLTSLQSAFSSLSAAEKAEAYIEYDSTVYHLAYLTGRFIAQSYDPTSGVLEFVLEVSNATAFRVSGTATTAMTTDSPSGSLKLYA